MEKYSKAVSEMYSQFKQKEAHPMEKYIGKHVVYWGRAREIVGYTTGPDGTYWLIIDASEIRGWANPGPDDVVHKKCKMYLYLSISYPIY